MERDVNRRQLLESLGGVAAVSALAGCQGGDSDGEGTSTNSGTVSGEMGEQVPTINFRWFTGSLYEQTAPLIAEGIRSLGFDVEVSTGEFATSYGATYDDTRDFDLILHFLSSRPARLDPNELMLDYAAHNAGANGRPSFTNWAHCEYTDLVVGQQNAASDTERREMVNEAQSVWGEELPSIPIVSYTEAGAYRSDQVNAAGLGEAQVTTYNPEMVIRSETVGDQALRIGSDTTALQPLNFLKMPGAIGQFVQHHIPHSSLFGYDPNWEHVNILAEDYEFENDGATIQITLRDGGTFHNGDPITSEDVKFTYEHIEAHTDEYLYAAEQNYSSIETPDDHTVVLNFEEPKPAFVTDFGASTGILHKQTFLDMGVDEDIDNYNMTGENYVGSGPYMPVNIEAGEQMIFEPHDGHPYYPTPSQDLVWLGFDGAQSRANAMINGEINISGRLPSGILDRLENDLGDNVTTTWSNGFTPFLVSAQCSFAPGKFTEFREAIAMAVNRNEINQVVYGGNSEPLMDRTQFPASHPWRAPDDQIDSITEETGGDPEAGKQVLRDAGWSQDANGNWHYPADADLEPLWPEGEVPATEDFPCVSELRS